MIQSYKTLPEFQYLQPRSLEEALEFLSNHKGEAVPLVGGTDLLLDMRMRLKKPKFLIDLKKIPELQKCSFTNQDGLKIGATTTYHELLTIPELMYKYTALYNAITMICDSILRQRASIVGNICTASPASDCAPPLLVFDSKLKIQSISGERTIHLNEFFTGVKKTILDPTELVTEITVPPPPDGAKSSYQKIMRNIEDLAVVGVAIFLTKRLKELRSLRIGVASVAPTPVLVNLDTIIDSNKSLNQRVDESLRTVLETISPISDVRGGAEYRKHLVEVLIRRGIKDLIGDL